MIWYRASPHWFVSDVTKPAKNAHKLLFLCPGTQLALSLQLSEFAYLGNIFSKWRRSVFRTDLVS